MRLLIVGHGRMGRLVEGLAPEYGFEMAGILEIDSNPDGSGVTAERCRGVDVAVDFSTAGLRTATAVARDRGVTVEWIEADVTAYEPATASFDLVLIAYLQLPTAQRRAVLTAGAGALAPGGTFFYVAHDRANLSDGHGGPQDPTVLAVADEVVDDLEGLEIIRAGPIERLVETEDGQTAAIDTLVRATRPITG